MTLLIADSGSTKTEWVLIESTNSNRRFITTRGLNPHFSTEEQIAAEIEKLVSELGRISVDKIFFYGAGCSTPEMAALVQKIIAQKFEGTKVVVETDLLAAAIACFNRREGIACIIGTGSNSCIYDGEKIVDRVPSLGFTLGDEGSGGYFGKKLIRDYYYGIMPEELCESLIKKFDMSLAAMLDHIYHQPRANAYVASFAYLLADFADHPYVNEVVEKGFNEFVSKQLHYYRDYEIRNVGFVGSVAALNRNILQMVLNRHGFELDAVVRRPIERLADSHLGIN